MSNFTITIMWGESPEPDATPKTYSFNTIPERDAFILGIKEMDGWQGYDVLEQKISIFFGPRFVTFSFHFVFLISCAYINIFSFCLMLVHR